jgi:dimethylargininase
MFKRALVRAPGKAYCRCISSHPLLHTLSLDRAKEQHAAYVNTLRELGLEIILLPPEDALPDACFVEDTAVIVGHHAVITRPKPESRRGETVSIKTVLNEFMEVQELSPPSTLEGGDVIHLEEYLISGVTSRTNPKGVEELSSKLGVRVKAVVDPDIVHLKSYVTYLGQNTIIGTERYKGHLVFAGIHYIVIPNHESYAANTLSVNGTILMPSGFGETQRILQSEGFDTIALDTSEFQKCEGALTCLSLLF